MGVCDCEKPKPQLEQRGKRGESILKKSEGIKRDPSNYFNCKTDVEKANTLVLNNDVLVAEGKSNPLEFYTKKKSLGKGAFGEVWLVNKKDSKADLAMKIIERNPEKSEDSEIRNEIKILKNLDHPNILKILDFYMTSDNFYIITECCPEGELFDEIISKGSFTEPQAAYVMHQLLCAIQYCHKMRIIHRDLKPENIMIDFREKNGFLNVKLIDFGTAKLFSEFSREKAFIGSSYYVAPEVINKNYDESCDIWSLGVIMYMMLTGQAPFEGDDDDEIMKKVKIGNPDTNNYKYKKLSPQAKDLIGKFLTYNPKNRITCEKALEHEWFKTVASQATETINQIDPQLARELINNMSNYKRDNILKCTVIAYLVHNNTHLQPCLEASKLFSRIDINHDGKIEKNELKIGLQKYWNLSDYESSNQAQRIFQNLDSDFNGYIEHEEFIRAAIDPKIFTSINYMKFAFNYFDSNRDGSISYEEISKKFQQNSSNKGMIDKELSETFRKMNISQNETITFDVFTRMMRTIMSS